ncbi:hypothetical protein [Micromonospora sp. NPDC048898]|uniref:hypothetical protein n=1 Tax=Micromonospora sp. NPDC048898 TaxID=3364260 RepID=UPI0037131D1F
MAIAEELGFLRPDVVIEPPAPFGLTDAVHDEDRQQVRLFRETGAGRWSGPGETGRPRGGAVNLRIPLRHPGLAELALARIRPTSADRLRQALELDDSYAAALGALLCEEPSFAPDRHVTHGGRVRYFGNGCVLVQSPVGSVVCDPFVSGKGSGADRYTVEDLPDFLDVALISEARVSRAVLESLVQLRGRVARIVVPRDARGAGGGPAVRLFLSRFGLPVTEVDDFDEVRFPGGSVVAAPVTGSGAARSAYGVQTAGACVYLGPDPTGVEAAGCRVVRRRLGRIDMAFFAMARDGGPSLDAARAAAAVTELGAEEAYLYGDGVPGDDQVRQFVSWCWHRGIVAEQLLGKREWCW